MRTYATDSARAAARIVALAMLVDGNLAPSELHALTHSRLLDTLAIDDATFHGLLRDLCHDLLSSAVAHECLAPPPATIDALLDEIRAPGLRRQLLRALWSIADADGVLSDAEAMLLARACTTWSAGTGFTPGAAAHAEQAPRGLSTRA